MPRVGFEPTIPVFERAETVHVLDRAATVNGDFPTRTAKNLFLILLTKNDHNVFQKYYMYIRSTVSDLIMAKNSIFWDITPCIPL
jgi:hypothetical protein